jgi:L-fucose isomerase
MHRKARQFHHEAFVTLARLGFHAIRPGAPTRTPEEAVQHIELLRQARAEAIVLYVADWSYSTTAAWSALLTDCPALVLWTNARPDCAGLIGAAVTKGALAEIGLEPPFVYGNFEDEATGARLRSLVVGKAAARRLRGLRYGLGGTRSLHMLPAAVDPTQWLTQFGVDVDGFDEVDIVDRSAEVPANDVMRHTEWLRKEFGGVEVDDTVVEISLRLYLALKQVIAERRFDFISVKCLPVMARVATSFCLAHALLGDGTDADGPKRRIACACEADSNGALTMQMMQCIDNQAVSLADVRWLDPATGVLRLSNCGSQPTEFARRRADVTWVKHGLQEFPWKHGGMCPQHVSKPGRVTLGRLSRIRGRYVMLITGGESLDKPKEALKETYWDFSPHAWVALDASVRAFTDALRSNHLHMMYGDFRRELTVLCETLDIEAMHPEGTEE